MSYASFCHALHSARRACRGHGLGFPARWSWRKRVPRIQSRVMIQPPACSVIAATLVAAATAVLATQVPAADYSVRPVPLMAVHVQDSFWSPRLDTNRLVTLWHDLKQ